ncbi:MAG TPA: L,D-transpeptidase family protein [Thermoleophilaceae bacterium]|nr:L,D-transpeptidase family protein [Thermoleophilaceae bacterium]
MRRLALPAVLLAALCPTAAAQAADVDAELAATTPTATTPAPPPPPLPPEPEPAPVSKAGKASIEVASGIPTSKLRYVARGARIEVTGKVRPFVAGQVALLEVRRSGRVVSRHRAQIRRARRGAGKATFHFKARRKGVYKLRVRHAATAEQGAFKSRAARIKAVVLSAGEGARGTSVLLLQRGLDSLGYAVPVTGYYDAGTSRAVIAFRKANGFDRTGFASRTVYSMVLRGAGGFRPRFPRAGYHVEYDWSRQVLAFVKGGRPVNVYHSSSGAPATPTVFGTFSFYRKEPGTNHLGMVQSNYFIGGYAIHGYHSVPTYPASHGCLRVPIPNAYQIDRQISLGMKIMVYR